MKASVLTIKQFVFFVSHQLLNVTNRNDSSDRQNHDNIQQRLANLHHSDVIYID